MDETLAAKVTKFQQNKIVTPRIKKLRPYPQIFSFSNDLHGIDDPIRLERPSKYKSEKDEAGLQAYTRCGQYTKMYGATSSKKHF